MRIDSTGSATHAAQLAASRLRQQGSVSVGDRKGVANGQQFRVIDRKEAIAAQKAQIPPAFAQGTTGIGASSSTPAVQSLRMPSETGNAIPGTYGQSHLDAIMAAWGATSGDERYQLAADVDGSGTVDFKDVTFVQANWGKKAPEVPGSTPDSSPRTYGQQHIDAALKAFGATKGDSRYSAMADADGNGVVDFKDVTYVNANWGRTIATA